MIVPAHERRNDVESAAASGRHVTASQFVRFGDRKGFELIDGRVIETSRCCESAYLGGRLFIALSNFNKAHDLGVCLPGGAVFRCFGDADDVRRSGPCFIGHARLPPRPWWDTPTAPPDLTTDVATPEESPDDAVGRLSAFLDAGSVEAWLVLPLARVGLVMRRDGSARWLREADAFDGGDLLPGFSLPLKDVLPARVSGGSDSA